MIDPSIASFVTYIKETETDPVLIKKLISTYKKFNKKIYYKSSLFCNQAIPEICSLFLKDKSPNGFLKNIDDGENVLSNVIKYIEPQFTFDINKFLSKLRTDLIKRKIVKKQIINWHSFFEYTRIILDDYLYRINKDITPDFLKECHGDIRLAIYNFSCETALEIMYLLSPTMSDRDDILDILIPLISSCTKKQSSIFNS